MSAGGWLKWRELVEHAEWRVRHGRLPFLREEVDRSVHIPIKMKIFPNNGREGGGQVDVCVRGRRAGALGTTRQALARCFPIR